MVKGPSQESTNRSHSSRKRRRTDPPVKDAQAQDDLPPLEEKHRIFTQWSRERGVEINKVQPAALPGRGVGLVTTARIRKDERILFVPKKAMFKPNEASSGKDAYDLLAKRGSPQAQLAFSLAAELQKEHSSLPTWQATWPTFEDLKGGLPLFWENKWAGYVPPSVDQPCERQRYDFERDLGEFKRVSKACHGDEDHFRYCWAIVNSRSFHFKPPGARPGYMVLCPFIDYMNHGPSGTGVKVSQMPTGYEVVADRDYAAGEEILATYGAHSNDKLLVHYGFVNTTSPGQPTDDDIRLDHLILPTLQESTKEALQDVGFLGGYALLPGANELCFKTQVAIRTKMLTANEWEYFISNGEDLSGDKSALVNQHVAEMLWDYQTEARRQIKLLSELEHRTNSTHADQTSLSLLKQRWKQIGDGVKAFLDALDP